MPGLLPTLGNGAATIGNPQQQDESLAQLLAMYQRAEAERKRGEQMGQTEYIKDSGALGVLASVAQAYMGKRVRREADESATDLTGRILEAQRREKKEEAAAAALAEEQKYLRERTRRKSEATELGLSGRDLTTYTLTGEMPKESRLIPQMTDQGLVMVDPVSGAYTPARAAQGDPATPAPTPGMGEGVMGDSLASAVEWVESRGNPNAVSPKGALGRMQTMPGTLRDPGYGIAPARDDSDAERTRVGREYLTKMTDLYGVEGGLAAYNWGPGNWEAALQRSGGDPRRALASAPAETRAYVPKVLGRTGGQPSAQPLAGGNTLRPAGYSRQVAADARAERGDARADEQMVLSRRSADRADESLRIQRENAARAANTPTEGERGAVGYYQRTVAAEKTLLQLEGSGYDPSNLRDQFTAGKGALRNWAATDEGQVYRQAQEDWVRAKLRKESGAAIPPDEMEREISTYFAQPGDSQQVIAQKARSREVAMSGLKAAAGRAVPKSSGKRLRFNPQTGKIE